MVAEMVGIPFGEIGIGLRYLGIIATAFKEGFHVVGDVGGGSHSCLAIPLSQGLLLLVVSLQTVLLTELIELDLILLPTGLVIDFLLLLINLALADPVIIQLIGNRVPLQSSDQVLQFCCRCVHDTATGMLNLHEGILQRSER